MELGAARPAVLSGNLDPELEILPGISWQLFFLLPSAIATKSGTSLLIHHVLHS